MTLFYGQKKSEYTRIKINDLKAIKRIEELLPALPPDCKISRYTCAIKKGESVFLIPDDQGMSPDEKIEFLKSRTTVDSKIYLDIKKFSCPLKREYKFIVTK